MGCRQRPLRKGQIINNHNKTIMTKRSIILALIAAALLVPSTDAAAFPFKKKKKKKAQTEAVEAPKPAPKKKQTP